MYYTYLSVCSIRSFKSTVLILRVSSSSAGCLPRSCCLNSLMVMSGSTSRTNTLLHIYRMYIVFQNVLHLPTSFHPSPQENPNLIPIFFLQALSTTPAPPRFPGESWQAFQSWARLVEDPGAVGFFLESAKLCGFLDLLFLVNAA